MSSTSETVHPAPISSSPAAPERPAKWSDPRYAERVLAWEQLTAAVTPTLFAELAPAPGERLLDVGCGTGGATLPAAARVGPGVAAARRRAADAGADNVTFALADMQTDQVDGGPFAAVLSQFGVMFFADPVAAFTNLHGQLAPGGRLCFACWQGAERNPWSFGELIADLVPARVTPPGGAFDLADPAHLRAVLDAAGFTDVTIAAHHGSADITVEAILTDDELALMGVATEHRAEAHTRVLRHLAPYRFEDNRYRMPIAYFVVSGRG